MRILISNDDGIFSQGIHVLAKMLNEIAEVIVIAPDAERSATGHAITMHQPLRVKKVDFFNSDIEAYAVNGTPADCIKLGVQAILKDRNVDLVVSGINNGPNLGTDVIYSGTVSAAVEAAILEIPSIAVSMGSRNISTYNDAAGFIKKISSDILNSKEILQETIINVNYPTCPLNEISGVKITTLGITKYDNSFSERKDPRGNSYYWMCGDVIEMEQDKESDILALKDNYISVSPIHFDLTNYKTFEKLRSLGLEKYQ
ncbi:5'/3'-nucleotidase SurE [Serpentinicella sp. ANB-PHB4]|uniref:5'/3'-nucleotidase SurE n=1 Tax=Serpentinicella sp. ANB-PHB4 TaxID=3074076 RepID=UPI002856F418|nr:5'/3'-nucleotidase SurE [Serpentinicella sp. ANB-PHB4]MDR5658142.1 5'/3'-nucleotidase SurE [Serpentinicella sp. ANB-PHB4]